MIRLPVERPKDAPRIETTFKKGELGESQDKDWHHYAERAVTISDQFLADISSGHVLNLTRVLAPLA